METVMDMDLSTTDVEGWCLGCGLHIFSGVYVIPGLGGTHCSVGCVETHLFGFDTCRWCANRIDKPYTGIDSRLCSQDCRENYMSHVMGDRSAALGSGKRLVLWLQSKETERKSKLGRPTKNGHVMSDSERKYNSRKINENVTKVES